MEKFAHFQMIKNNFIIIYQDHGKVPKIVDLIERTVQIITGGSLKKRSQANATKIDLNILKIPVEDWIAMNDSSRRLQLIDRTIPSLFFMEISKKLFQKCQILGNKEERVRRTSSYVATSDDEGVLRTPDNVDGTFETASKKEMVFEQIKTNLESLLAPLNNNLLIDNRFAVTLYGNKIEEQLKLLERYDGWRETVLRYFIGQVVDLKYPLEMFILNAVQTIKLINCESVSTKELSELHDSLNLIIYDLEHELTRIKNFHHRYAPKRQEEIKGIVFLSKYCNGEKAGGEFFDIINRGKKICIVLSASTSYLFSGIILNNFSILREKSDISLEDLQLFMKSTHEQIVTSPLSSKKKVENYPPLQLLTAEIDVRTLLMRGYNHGKSLIVSPSKTLLSETVDATYFEYKLMRGEKLAIFSPGLRENCDDQLNNQSLAEFAKEHLFSISSSFADEIFFQLKKKANSDFLMYDASLIIIEVKENVIVEA